MSVHSLLHPPLVAGDADQLAATCTLGYIARRLGKAGWGDTRLCSYVQALVDQRGFPKPFPELVGRGEARQLTDRVRPGSTWQRWAVQDWLGDHLPPDAAAALDAAAKAAAAAEMDGNAGNLRLVAGGRRA